MIKLRRRAGIPQLAFSLLSALYKRRDILSIGPLASLGGLEAGEKDGRVACEGDEKVRGASLPVE
jgi:hypothetical protein